MPVDCDDPLTAFAPVQEPEAVQPLRVPVVVQERLAEELWFRVIGPLELLAFRSTVGRVTHVKESQLTTESLGQVYQVPLHCPRLLQSTVDMKHKF